MLKHNQTSRALADRDSEAGASSGRASSGRIAFEDRLVRLALFLGLLPTLCCCLLLVFIDFSIYPKILLILILLTSVFYCAFSIRQQVIFQLRTSTNLVEAMTSNDYSLRANNKGLDGALSDFNLLLNTLSATLAEQSLITREQQILLEKVTAQIDVAIIAVDNNAAISLMNPAAEKLFTCRFEELQGWPIKQLGLQNVLTGDYNTVAEFEIQKYKKKVFIRTDQYFEKGVKHTLIFITDIQNLLREEERQAWQKLLRVLSHEINNSIAPIASIGETLGRMVDKQHSGTELDNDLKEGLAVITERAQSLNLFIQRYQTLAKLPLPNKSMFAIKPLLHSVSLLFADVTIGVDSEDIQVYADKDQLQQVLVNLIKNACEAMLKNPLDDIQISCTKHEQNVQIQVFDQGTGISNMDNVFIPFYTTKKLGTGIGLSLCRQIMMNHGGDLVIQNHEDKQGVEAKMIFPSE
jgi:nitrogen fixation/metabolism regulation signal transduction histidine kinase